MEKTGLSTDWHLLVKAPIYGTLKCLIKGGTTVCYNFLLILFQQT